MQDKELIVRVLEVENAELSCVTVDSFPVSTEIDLAAYINPAGVFT
ncbi:hypothetical protein [Corynebacterium glutamicum]|nr:hypothetical protein [Corynebacterium glutamicum]